MRRRIRLTGGAATTMAALLASALVMVPSHAEPATAMTQGGQPEGGDWVTLITGDRVLVRSAGGRTELTVRPAPRSRPAGFQELTRHGDRYLLPADAAELVQQGALDWELFNVTGLVRQGYDDKHTARLPLLVKYTDAAAVTRAAALPNTVTRRSLATVGMAAVDAEKSRASRLWSRLAPNGGESAPAGDPGLSRGVKKVWLNGKVRGLWTKAWRRSAPPPPGSRA
ncbi:hypothetical protein [Nonomuraea basaltis]|uniref:hypothetical protein n=1 Tax=Nonomuraea basaltis TaxID=2495887 RepID=UPI00110C5F73|nr:hypothetical protein [Nonomuraea basaltis]TMR91885.1 hypothetical protein EJK15_47530 [Nonomuraea basaltis]